MQYDVDGGRITVIVGNEARIDVPTAINYIKSGEAEINEVADTRLAEYNANAVEKTTAFDNNASNKTTDFNNNASDKTDAFNLNATNKTTAYNDNAALKQAAVDASADAAAASATLAQEWAVKMDGKVADEDYSAKYYADLASQAAGATGANIDLSNLSPTGEAKFTAKQDVISDLATIRSGAALGDTSVQLSGAQTITGAKTFEGQVKRQNSTIIKGTAPASAATTTIEFTDKNGVALGYVYHTYGIDKTSTTVLQAVKANASGDNDYANISVRYPPSGSPYTYCLTPTDTTSTSSHQIATVGWVNSTGNNVVHLTDTETISGVKTFTGSTRNRILSTENRTGTFMAQNMKYALGTTPSSDILTQMQMRDSSDDWVALWEHAYRSDGSTQSALACRRANKSASNSLIVGYDRNGTVYTYAPACDLAGSIVTTVNKSKASKGYYQLGNGLIINWGYYNSGGTSGTINFAKSYTAYSRVVATSSYGFGDSPWGVNITTTTTSKFDWYQVHSQGFWWIAVGY